MTGLPTINLYHARNTMARRRGHSARHPLWLVLAGVLVTGVLASTIQRANTITALREDIRILHNECDEAEATRALLSVRWNAESSRQVVMRRAKCELDLVCPDAPAMVLFKATEGAVSQAEETVVAMHFLIDILPTAAASERP